MIYANLSKFFKNLKKVLDKKLLINKKARKCGLYKLFTNEC